MSNEAAAQVFDALGDSTRRAIIESLAEGPMPVGKLADRLPVGRPNVSKHLKVLQAAKLVEHRTIGTRNLYALAPGGLAVVQQWLIQHWDGALNAFAAHVHQRNEGDPTS
ncbi:MAG: ArsR/SmtB family transcription factor [Desertimonas sp.]